MKDLFRVLLSGEALGKEHTFEIVTRMMVGADEPLSEAQIGAYLFATAARAIHPDELTGGARALRSYMVSVNAASMSKEELLDTCGTGGSGKNTFNTSTVGAFVCAAAGQYVAKHGNRGSTSKCGSVDLLEALGVKFALEPEQVLECLAETKFCFMFAPKHHAATARVGKIRKELGFRTIFNFLGPLSNPAAASYQLLGVSDGSMVEPIAKALMGLGIKRAMVVSGEDGLDEITLTTSTLVTEIEGEKLHSYRISPSDFGLAEVPFSSIEGFEAEQSAERVRELLDGKKDAYRDLVAVNAGAALYVCGKAESLKGGVEIAYQAIDSGRAKETLMKVIEVSNRYA